MRGDSRREWMTNASLRMSTQRPREECEEKLAEMIMEMKAEIKAEKERREKEAST